MARLRIVFALVAIGLLVPGALLVRRALESVRVEQETRHRAVAERIFDEMERSLSDFLRREEERPLDQYSFYRRTADGREIRSPLAELAQLSFLVGHFQVEQDGQVTTPLRPEDAERAAARGDYPPDPERERRAKYVVEVAAAVTLAESRDAPEFRDRLTPRAKADVPPGKKEAAIDGARESGAERAYDALVSLNRGAQERAEREQKVIEEPPPSVFSKLRSYATEAVAELEAPAPPADSPSELAESAAPHAESTGALAESVVVPAESETDALLADAERMASALEQASGSAALEKDADDARLDEKRSGFVEGHGSGRARASAPLAAAAPSAARGDRAQAKSAFEGLSAAEEFAVAEEPEAVADEELEAAGDEELETAAGEEREAALDKEPEANKPEPQRALAPAAASVGRAPDLAAKAPASSDLRDERAEQSAEPVRRNVAKTAPQPPPAPLRVTVDPMIGRLAASGDLVLTRTILVGNQGIRQGLVLDVEGLGQQLGAETLADLPSGQVSEVRFARTAKLAAPAAESFHYRHEFAEPFDALAVAFRLAPLGGTTGARTILWLSAALLAAGGVGLFAVYRMVGVALHFAERRSNFVAAVSHELKTPLTAIRMYAEMLRDGLVPSDEKRHEYYGSITAESERLSRLIDNVLEFSRLEKGTRSMEVQVGDVAPVVAEAVALLRPHADRQGQRLVLELEAGLPPVRFERDAILQVLFNLIDNALKYGRTAEDPVIRISCRRKQQGVEIGVHDQGPGVAKEHLSRILEPFYRGEAELTRRTQGAGIGLALAGSLLEQMGAHLRVGNAPEGGFEARVELSEGSAA